MAKAEINKELRQIIKKHLCKEGSTVGDNDSLQDKETIAPRFIFEVMEYIKGNFSFIKREHLSGKSFLTINTIVGLIFEKSQKFDKIKKELRRYVQIWFDTNQFDDSQNLFIIDAVAAHKFSLFLMKYLEEFYKIYITQQYFKTHNLNSINGITHYIYAHSETTSKAAKR